MRRKKSSAIAVKFEAQNTRWDEITDMEGALHTFVTPIIPYCEIVGDYRYQYGHGVTEFGTKNEKVLVRRVVMSAGIQMDFEDHQVMLRACRLDGQKVVGCDGGEWEILSVEEKQDRVKRKEYDEMIRRHLVFHLTRDRILPAMSKTEKPLTVEEAVILLETLISSTSDISDALVDKFMETPGDQIISLELLFNTAIQQARNEFSALEALCPQGYIYTYDPASIFAAQIGWEILNRLMLAAVKVLSDRNWFEKLRVFAFNDFVDASAVVLAEKALRKQVGVMVVRKASLFGGVKGQYDISGFAERDESSLNLAQSTSKRLEEAMLVIHNNSDGFGQNIETEHASSLDGAIGTNSSAAASLKRDRKDLLDFVF
jgi:hypothetical protein